MIWQDTAMLAAQGSMLLALIPTLQDRSRWPARSTCAWTTVALLVMATTLATLSLIATPAILVLLALAWGRMAWR